MLFATEAEYSGPRSITLRHKGHTFRAIWSRLYVRPKNETLHEFVVLVLKWTLGRSWYEAQLKTPADERHVIMKWVFAWHALARANEPAEHKPGEVYSGEPTGEAQALLSLADDVYRLQLVRRLPPELVKRLKSKDGFQGARYEIAVAACFVRCGFEIDWIKEKAVKHCEFNATHKASGEMIAVEAKSRHRAGVLHQPGERVGAEQLRADVERLYREALDQNPCDKPFAIFIDVNLPPEPERQGLSKTWMADIKELLDSQRTPRQEAPEAYAFLVVTNFSWHYEGAERAGPPEFLFVVPIWARHPLKNAKTLDALRKALNNYGFVRWDE